MVKLVNKIQQDNKMRLSIYSNAGVPVTSYDVSQDQLLSGFRLEMSSLPSGYYFIQISSTSILQVFKILKN